MGKKKVGQFIFPTGTQTEQIEQAFKLLSLDACSASFRILVDRVQTDHGTFYDLLQALLEMEFAQKEDGRIARWVQQAKFAEPPMGLKDYDFSEQPSIDPVQIHELASCRFIEEGKNVMFFGAPGVGKTHLSCALALEAISRGFEARFMRLNDFIIEAEKPDDSNILRLQRALISPRLLIMDDIDYYKTSDEAAAFLFDVIKQRYEDKSSTIITSNKNPKEWTLFGGDKERKNAAYDRLFDRQRAVIINISGGRSHRVSGSLQDPHGTHEPTTPTVIATKPTGFTRFKKVFR